MERAGEFLGKTLRRLDRPEAALAWLASRWPAIAGEALAAHTRPLRCHAGCLDLTADGTVWQDQLESMKQQLCGQINHAWGGNLVREVRFVAARPAQARVSFEADNSHIPFVRRRT
ncbi:MAG TPA: DUF721 domain-containing protein [Candidatus Acidoferrales bacterium]|nr:DUF721 domain-containing protein [Candidatus Acidoferrales bacterium]